MINLKKSLGLIVLYLLVSIMLCFLVSNIRANEVRIINNDDYLVAPYYKFKLTTNGNITKKEFLDIIKDVEVIYKYNESWGKKFVYYGSKNKYRPELKYENYFTDEDFLLGEYIGIGGHNFLNHNTKIEGKDLIFSNKDFLDGTSIKFVDEILTTSFDQKNSSWYVNLGAVIDYEGIEGIYYYSGDKAIFSNDSGNYQVEFLENDRIVWQGFNFFDTNNLKIMVSFSIIILCSILIINMTLMWMDSYYKEIAVRRIFGATKRKIFGRLVIVYWCSAILSYIIAVVIYWLLSNSDILNGFLGILGIKEILIILVFIFTSANIILLLLCLNSLKKVIAANL